MGECSNVSQPLPFGKSVLAQIDFPVDWEVPNWKGVVPLED